MSMIPSIYLNSPVNSALVNARFKRVFAAGPREGFHVTETDPPSMSVLVKNTNSETGQNTLITKDGTAITETENEVGEVLLPGAGEFFIVVIFDQAAGDTEASLGYVDLDERFYLLDTETPIMSLETDGVSVTEDGMFPLYREELLEESLFGLQHTRYSPAVIDGAWHAIKSVTLQPISAYNSTAKTSPNFGPVLEPAVDTYLYMNAGFPTDFAGLSDDHLDSKNVYVNVWFQMMDASVATDVYLKMHILKLAEGPAESEIEVLAYDGGPAYTMEYTDSENLNVATFNIGESIEEAEWGLEPGDQFVLRLERFGTDDADTCTADILVVGAVLFYPAARIGTPVDFFD